MVILLSLELVYTLICAYFLLKKYPIEGSYFYSIAFYMVYFISAAIIYGLFLINPDYPYYRSLSIGLILIAYFIPRAIMYFYEGEELNKVPNQFYVYFNYFSLYVLIPIYVFYAFRVSRSSYNVIIGVSFYVGFIAIYHLVKHLKIYSRKTKIQAFFYLFYIPFTMFLSIGSTVFFTEIGYSTYVFNRGNILNYPVSAMLCEYQIMVILILVLVSAPLKSMFKENLQKILNQ